MPDQILFEPVAERKATPALSQIWSALSPEVRGRVLRLLVELALKVVLAQRQNQVVVTQAESGVNLLC